MATLQLVRVHEPDAVRAIVREAWDIALAEASGPEYVRATFDKACDSLAARIPLQPAPVGPLTVPSLGLRG